jgi:hypothetical protein
MPLPKRNLIPGILILLAMISLAAPPLWWSEGNPPVVTGVAENNKGPANIGQAKNMVAAALQALDTRAPTIATQVRADLAISHPDLLTVPNPKIPEWIEKQKAPLLLGQLKAIADPFYTRLHAAAPAWLEAERILNGTDDANKAIANIGQLKAVFSLRFESLPPDFTDDDYDGMDDDWEIAHGLDPNDGYDTYADPDADGIQNLYEYVLGFHPTSANPAELTADRDNDGMPDLWEAQTGSFEWSDENQRYEFQRKLDWENTADATGDPDADSLTNLAEYQFSTDPLDPDSDDDFMPDGFEVQYSGAPVTPTTEQPTTVQLNPNNPADAGLDPDQDSLSNLQEYLFSTQPNRADSDGDNATDGAEISAGADPNDPSDGGVPGGPGSGAVVVEMPFAIGGDYAWWQMIIEGKGPTDTRIQKIHSSKNAASGYGDYIGEIQLVKLHAGNTYHIKMKRMGGVENWYCWSANVGKDATGALLPNGQTFYNYPDSKADRLTDQFIAYPIGGENTNGDKATWLVDNKEGLFTQHVDDHGKDVAQSLEAFLLPVEVAVDADRDGEITFDGKDKTTAGKPFRFWINNDQDDVEADEPVDVDENSRDLLDNTIKTKRDLEDFTRIRLSVGLPIDALRDGSWKVGLKFRDSGGQNPSIRIWPNESDTGSDSYLTDGTVAGRQISEQPFGETYSGTVFIPASYWTDRSDTEAHLIFEGSKKGMGELILVLKEEGSTAETETASLHLNLLDVREMFQRARIVNSASEIPDPWVDDTPPAQTWAWDPWNWPYSEDPEAEEVTAIFVHGWRMDYNEYLSWAQTSFKRLWHKGFKGKFYSFRWATYSPSVFTYNGSEYRAWLCGSALASWVNSLPHSSTKRNIFAHSMGNVICGAALRKGMEVENYALCNAAMAAMAYDSDPLLKNDPDSGQPWSRIWSDLGPKKTPDTDPQANIRDTFGFNNKFNENSALPQMFSFVLPEDSALDLWVLNNQVSKPDSGGHSYYYQETPIAPNISYKLFQAAPNANPREVTQQPEGFGYVTKSLTRTAGAELRTGDAIGGSHDMSSWGVGANHAGFGDEHSAQWKWNNQSTCLFWEMLSEELQLR